jgi:hypothetical protein
MCAPLLPGLPNGVIGLLMGISCTCARSTLTALPKQDGCSLPSEPASDFHGSKKYSPLVRL